MREQILIGMCILLLLVSGCIKNEANCQELQGEIKDFDVSASGFGHTDKAKVSLQNNRILTIEGWVVMDLEVGKCLYELCVCTINTPHCWRINEC